MLNENGRNRAQGTGRSSLLATAHGTLRTREVLVGLRALLADSTRVGEGQRRSSCPRVWALAAEQCVGY